MLGKQGKNEIALKCTNSAFPEFPEIKFGTDQASGVSYFDATAYLSQTSSNRQVNQFFVQYQVPILALCEAYGKERETIMKINEEGHYLIDGNFVYLFISFVDPQFFGYIFDRIHELFLYGVSVSDTYLLQSAHRRLSPDVLKMIIENEKESE